MRKLSKLLVALSFVFLLTACQSGQKSNLNLRNTDTALSNFEQAQQIINNDADGVIIISSST